MQCLEDTRQFVGRDKRNVAAFAPRDNHNITILRDLITKFREIRSRLCVSRLSLHMTSLTVLDSFTVQQLEAVKQAA